MRRPTLRHVLLLFTAISSCLPAQPAFLRKDIFVGEPLVVAAGDFNGDGRRDLAVATADGVFTFLNTGGGTLGGPIRSEGVWGTDLASDYFSKFVAVADFNGDGIQDLAGNHVLLLSRGDGTFSIAPPILDIVVGAGDFNGDGKVDLLEGDRQGMLRVLLGNGDGTFRVGATITSPHREPEVFVPAVADFNRDGHLDVGVRSWPLPDGPSFRVFLNRGDTFDPTVPISLSCGPGCPAVTADFNGDGVPDLVFQGGVALGRGDGTFRPPESAGLSAPFYIVAADLTGDGHLDMVTGPALTIFPGNGDGTFSSGTVQLAGSSFSSGFGADLDGDGRVDLAVVDQEANRLSILFSRAQGGAAVWRAVSAASGAALVAPQSLTTLFAPIPLSVPSAGAPPWTTTLGGISLGVRDSTGAARLAPLLYVSPTQVNFQVPPDTATGEATIAIIHDGVTTPAGSMEVAAAAPGLFLISGAPAMTAVLVQPDGTQNAIPVAAPIPLSIAGAGSIYLSFFGTGFRGAARDNVTCSVNGMQVPVIRRAAGNGGLGPDQHSPHAGTSQNRVVREHARDDLDQRSGGQFGLDSRSIVPRSLGQRLGCECVFDQAPWTRITPCVRNVWTSTGTQYSGGIRISAMYWPTRRLASRGAPGRPLDGCTWTPPRRRSTRAALGWPCEVIAAACRELRGVTEPLSTDSLEHWKVRCGDSDRPLGRVTPDSYTWQPKLKV